MTEPSVQMGPRGISCSGGVSSLFRVGCLVFTAAHASPVLPGS